MVARCRACNRTGTPRTPAGNCSSSRSGSTPGSTPDAGSVTPIIVRLWRGRASSSSSLSGRCSMFHLLFQALLPVICGAVTTPLFNVIQKGIGVVTKLPPPLTRIVVGATAAGVYALGVKGFALTGSDVLTVTPTTILV